MQYESGVLGHLVEQYSRR